MPRLLRWFLLTLSVLLFSPLALAQKKGGTKVVNLDEDEEEGEEEAEDEGPVTAGQMTEEAAQAKRLHFLGSGNPVNIERRVGAIEMRQRKRQVKQQQSAQRPTRRSGRVHHQVHDQKQDHGGGVKEIDT